jgi:hypothetical protein
MTSFTASRSLGGCNRKKIPVHIRAHVLLRAAATSMTVKINRRKRLEHLVFVSKYEIYPARNRIVTALRKAVHDKKPRIFGLNSP